MKQVVFLVYGVEVFEKWIHWCELFFCQSEGSIEIGKNIDNQSAVGLVGRGFFQKELHDNFVGLEQWVDTRPSYFFFSNCYVITCQPDQRRVHLDELVTRTMYQWPGDGLWDILRKEVFIGILFNDHLSMFVAPAFSFQRVDGSAVAAASTTTGAAIGMVVVTLLSEDRESEPIRRAWMDPNSRCKGHLCRWGSNHRSDRWCCLRWR